uniref:Uncharacterized protein n=1 Tax=Knipowitschia caucasica TaxID=637954 RepID=A0AAV2LX10_KNICA
MLKHNFPSDCPIRLKKTL